MNRCDFVRWRQQWWQASLPLACAPPDALDAEEPLPVPIGGHWVALSLDPADQRILVDLVLGAVPDAIDAATLHRQLLLWCFEHPFEIDAMQFVLASDGSVLMHTSLPLASLPGEDDLINALLGFVDDADEAWDEVCTQTLLAAPGPSAPPPLLPSDRP